MNRRERSVVRAGLALGVFLGLAGCRATVPPAPVETVGTLAAGPSVYTAPLARDAPPELGFVAGSDDDSTGEVATTVTRVDSPESPDGSADAAPTVENKASHGF